MLKVHFTSALKRFFPDLKTIEVEARTMGDAVEKVELIYPGMKSYLLDDDGSLRKHVNLFIGEELAGLDSEIKENDEIFIFQALSGG